MRHPPSRSSSIARSSHFVDLVEPLPIVVPDHWEIGVSEVGVTTVMF